MRYTLCVVPAGSITCVVVALRRSAYGMRYSVFLIAQAAHTPLRERCTRTRAGPGEAVRLATRACPNEQQHRAHPAPPHAPEPEPAREPEGPEQEQEQEHPCPLSMFDSDVRPALAIPGNPAQPRQAHGTRRSSKAGQGHPAAAVTRGPGAGPRTVPMSLDGEPSIQNLDCSRQWPSPGRLRADRHELSSLPKRTGGNCSAHLLGNGEPCPVSASGRGHQASAASARIRARGMQRRICIHTPAAAVDLLRYALRDGQMDGRAKLHMRVRAEDRTRPCAAHEPAAACVRVHVSRADQNIASLQIELQQHKIAGSYRVCAYAHP
ncbi:hypothetical protein DENSPDRAFT_519059 [Dentipellis sp. KUC8613]|nr:hypothetical protein DENSPDRAFT_519059 [Dentipellis sp. KUC8613]